MRYGEPQNFYFMTTPCNNAVLLPRVSNPYRWSIPFFEEMYGLPQVAFRAVKLHVSWLFCADTIQLGSIRRRFKQQPGSHHHTARFHGIPWTLVVVVDVLGFHILNILIGTLIVAHIRGAVRKHCPREGR